MLQNQTHHLLKKNNIVNFIIARKAHETKYIQLHYNYKFSTFNKPWISYFLFSFIFFLPSPFSCIVS